MDKGRVVCAQIELPIPMRGNEASVRIVIWLEAGALPIPMRGNELDGAGVSLRDLAGYQSP